MTAVSNATVGTRKWTGPVLAVWSVWALMTIGALTYVSVYGRNVPSWDEWDMVPTVTGVQPVTWEWLWSQHNEHRIPVPRLIMLVVYGIAGDFRAAMVMNVALVSAMTAYLLRILARLRGRYRWTDLFLPVVALNLGQGLNFIWGWQIEFFVSTAFLLGMLTVVVRNPGIGRGAMLAVAGLMILLTGSGAHGLAPIPAMVVWSLGVGWLSRGHGRMDTPSKPIGWGIACSVAALGVALIAFYLMGYEKVPHHPSSSGLKQMVLTPIRAITMSFGAGTRDVWPVSGALMLAVVAVTLARLGMVFWRTPEERVRAWGLFCFIGAVGGLAAALGLGRDGFEPRYITLLFPVLFGIYFVWALYGKGKPAEAIRVSLAVAAVLLIWPNTRHGLAYAKDVSTRLAEFEQQMKSGVPLSRLIARHSKYLHPAHDLLTDYLPLLRTTKLGAFASLQDDEPFEHASIGPERWEITGGSREGRTIEHKGKAWITITFPRPTLVAGVTLVYDFENRLQRQPFIFIEWRGEGQPYAAPERSYYWSPTGDRANWERRSFLRLNDADPRLQCWIWAEVTELRIMPDYSAGTFELKELVLTTPSGVEGFHRDAPRENELTAAVLH